jgi:asparagine synthetase B (glutamine-hydrolysing)
LDELRKEYDLKMQIINEIENEKKLRADYEEMMLKITYKQRAEEIKG